MRRMLLGLLCTICLLPGSSRAFSFFSVADAQIRKISAHTFRLQVEVNFGGHFVPPALPPGAEWVSDPEIYFTRFNLSAPESAFNFFSQDGGSLYTDPWQTCGAWQSVGSYHSPGTLGRIFGYDFESNDVNAGLPALQYSATLEWCRQVVDQPTGGSDPEWGDWLGEEQHAGAVVPRIVPEPTSLTLLALGLFGLPIFRRRK